MRFVFFLSEATSKSQMDLYSDLREYKECCFYSPFGSSFLGKFLRIILMWLSKFSKKDYLKAINDRRCCKHLNSKSVVIIESGYLATCSKGIFELIKHNDNVQFVCLMLEDAMEASSPSLLAVKDLIIEKKWDVVFSVEKKDCEKYGWRYVGQMYSSRKKNAKRNRTSRDLYFVGGLKGGREELILSCFKELTSKGVNCSFDLWCHTTQQYKERMKSRNLNFRKHFLKYSTVWKNVEESNCILEILQNNQESETLRWFEAVYLNKKLLTNNPNVVNLPYYNHQYMHYFKTTDDIDIEWVKTKEIVDYGYKGDFSPSVLLEKIKEEIREKEVL